MKKIYPLPTHLVLLNHAEKYIKIHQLLIFIQENGIQLLLFLMVLLF